MSLKNKLTLGFGAALCILAMIGVLSYRRFSRENVDQQWVEHTHQVLEKLDSTLASLLELNAEERGFALTHDSTHLQSSRHLKGAIDSNLKLIKTLTADNPRQQVAYARLVDLVGARVALIEQAETQSSSDENLEKPRNELTGQIRAVLLDMRMEEEKLLGKRLQEAAAGNRQMKAILDVGYAFSLLLFGLTVYAIFREIEKRKESEESLRRAEEQYRLLFDSNPIPVWVYDLETLDILDVNATASNRYGYTREEFLRLKISDLRPQADVPNLLKNVREATQSVQDSGPGVNPDALATLFQPFRHARGRDGYCFSGTGLGLAITRKLVRALGSTLELETRPGWGTRFFFELDLPRQAGTLTPVS